MAKVVKCIYPTDKDATAGIEIDAFLSGTGGGTIA